MRPGTGQGTPTGRVPAVGMGLCLVAAGSLLLGPPAAADDDPTRCLADGGIYVYVHDRRTPVVQGCTRAATGYGRVSELADVETVGQGFICRIAGLPAQCSANPDADGNYWSYWWWRDGEWTYANVGGSYPGVPGSIEAWHFAAGEAPPIHPDVSGTRPATPGDPDVTTSGDPGVAPGDPGTQAGDPSTASGDPSGTPPEDLAEQPGSDRPWLPTALTFGALAAAAIGYAAWRSRGRG